MQFGRENYSVMGDLVYLPMHTAYMATVSTHTGAISVDQSRSAHMIITPTHASDRLRPTRYVPGIYVARAKIQWYFYLRSKIGYNHYSKHL